MNYYNEIKNKIRDEVVYSKVKDYSKERNKVITYFEIGRLLYEAGTKYGFNIIDEYSKKLVIEVGKKYNKRTLFRIRQFYIIFSDEKVSTLSTQLTWSHYTELLAINDVNKIRYYIILAYKGNLSIRKLRNKIKNNEYERLSEEAKTKFINKEEPQITDLIKNPILIKNTREYEMISEKTLQKIILEDIESFMKELGNTFCFIGSEYKIKIGDVCNYIDLLLYNINYGCYVVIELKITELKKDHIGQVQIYMNYIDNTLKTINQDKTIGIIICKKNNKYIMEYCSDYRILAKEYKLV